MPEPPILPTSVLLLFTTNGAPSREEQLAACRHEDDLIVDVGQVGLPDLPKRLRNLGVHLGEGDKIKVYDLSCLPISHSTLLQLMTKILGMGVAIELCGPCITVRPDADNELYRMVFELDRHWRRLHGLKRQAHESKVGRKPRLLDAQLPQIRHLLEQDGANVSSVAKELGVSRSTLFDYIQRHKDPAQEHRG